MNNKAKMVKTVKSFETVAENLGNKADKVWGKVLDTEVKTIKTSWVNPMIFLAISLFTSIAYIIFLIIFIISNNEKMFVSEYTIKLFLLFFLEVFSLPLALIILLIITNRLSEKKSNKAFLLTICGVVLFIYANYNSIISYRLSYVYDDFFDYNYPILLEARDYASVFAIFKEILSGDGYFIILMHAMITSVGIISSCISSGISFVKMMVKNRFHSQNILEK